MQGKILRSGVSGAYAVVVPSARGLVLPVGLFAREALLSVLNLAREARRMSRLTSSDRKNIA